MRAEIRCRPKPGSQEIERAAASQARQISPIPTTCGSTHRSRPLVSSTTNQPPGRRTETSRSSTLSGSGRCSRRNRAWIRSNRPPGDPPRSRHDEQPRGWSGRVIGGYRCQWREHDHRVQPNLKASTQPNRNQHLSPSKPTHCLRPTRGAHSDWQEASTARSLLSSASSSLPKKWSLMHQPSKLVKPQP